MYFKGNGIPQDFIHAHMWFILAAAGGDEKGRANRDLAAEKMTSTQVAEAQRLAANWTTKSGGKKGAVSYTNSLQWALGPMRAIGCIYFAGGDSCWSWRRGRISYPERRIGGRCRAGVRDGEQAVKLDRQTVGVYRS
jgi:hypothetical protein